MVENRDALPSMWIDGADLIRTSNYMLTPSDKDLWKNIGAKTGLGSTDIDEYIGKTTSTAEESVDCLKEYGFKKIAIVSLQEKSALMAAEHIKKRTGATVTVVSAHVAGTQTKEACAADVILFVWAKNKHAVFRAFDKVKDKVAYVAGTGATSIIRSLEKWTIKKNAAV